MRKWLPYWVVLLHTILVFGFAFLLAQSLDLQSADSLEATQVLWTLFMAIDFPAGIFGALVLRLFSHWFPGTEPATYSMWGECWFPAFYFAIIGAIQWYLIVRFTPDIVNFCRMRTREGNIHS